MIWRPSHRAIETGEESLHIGPRRSALWHDIIERLGRAS
jgi:hypothetical protein